MSRFNNGNYPALSVVMSDDAIDVCHPPIMTGLSAVKADGTDPLGDTNRLQAIINYGIAHARDVYVPKNLTLQPIAQTDGTLVCSTFDDGKASTGNSRTSFRMFAKKGVQISTNNTTSAHTIFRWKLGDSVLDGFQFVGTQGYTKGLELSRINLKDTTEADTTSRNRFTNMRFVSCNYGITMEGSCYYNTFDNVTFYSCNQTVWLKVTYAMANGLLSSGTVDSNVNRNNFYSMSAFGGANGILLDYGDTNKFYSLSFEGLTGTAIRVNDQQATYSGAFETQYNGFYGVTNENNGTDLVYNNPHGADNFVDFNSPFSKCTFNYRPSIFIPSGDKTSNHLFMQVLSMTNDANVLTYIKNKAYTEWNSYFQDIADYVGTDANGYLRGFSWRNFNFTTAQCTNVATLAFNSGTTQALFKSIGGIVFYFAKFNMTATTTTSAISIPLPELTPDTNTFGFNNNYTAVTSVGYTQNGGAPQILPALLDTTNKVITIQPPSGGWAAGSNASENVITVNINYPRQGAVNLIDTN